MVHRNDGIGGTPRLTRYTSIGTPPRVDPTPNRPPLPQRTPGESDAADPADTVLAHAVQQARLDIATHLPSRIGDCRECDVAAPCRPFLRALVILDRWDPVKARRVRAVLQLSGLMLDGYPHGEDDDMSDEPLRVGETLHLGKADWVYDDCSMRVRVSDIRYGHDSDESPVIGILATIVGGGRDGRMVAIAVY
ncbi:hypothetical protein [Micromonospora sp. LOL_023]|uniref:hypothetical protein n=1 Tax=Micromonospora sp. LOL_023 TaxID=3345418 RepID=UPI003A8C28A9